MYMEIEMDMDNCDGFILLAKYWSTAQCLEMVLVVPELDEFSLLVRY